MIDLYSKSGRVMFTDYANAYILYEEFSTHSSSWIMQFGKEYWKFSTQFREGR